MFNLLIHLVIGNLIRYFFINDNEVLRVLLCLFSLCILRCFYAIQRTTRSQKEKTKKLNYSSSIHKNRLQSNSSAGISIDTSLNDSGLNGNFYFMLKFRKQYFIQYNKTAK